jgi:hypothetical protein
MSSRSQSTPLAEVTPGEHLDPGPPQTAHALAPPEQVAFRETFVWRFERREVRAAFRLIGDALFDLLDEAGGWGPEDGAPLTHGELRAACRDLTHLSVYLETVAWERHASDLDGTSATLAVEASGWARRLFRLVLDMRRSLEEAAEAFGGNVDHANEPSD